MLNILMISGISKRSLDKKLLWFYFVDILICLFFFDWFPIYQCVSLYSTLLLRRKVLEIQQRFQRFFLEISTKNKQKQKNGSPLIGLGQNVGIVTCLGRKVSEFFASGSVYMYHDYRHIIIFFKIFYGWKVSFN